MIDIVFDCLRVAHMAAFAVGIGGAAFLELHLTKRVHHAIDAETLRLIDLGHELIKLAVLGLWMTGLGLLFFRLQVYEGVFSAKLGAKLLIVSGLTVNMLVIQRVALPALRQFEGRGYADMPTTLLGRLGAIAGFSAGTWVSALLLGGIGRFKTMEPLQLAEVLLPLLTVATLGGAVLAVAVGAVAGHTAPGKIVPGE